MKKSILPRMLFILIFSVMTSLDTTALSLNNLSELQKIEFLLTTIENSDVIFIRNDVEYTSVEASKHLSLKFENAQNSIFAPKKDKWTAIMFIEKLASKSSLSGKPYYIKFKDGKKIESSIWLKQKLSELTSQP